MGRKPVELMQVTPVKDPLPGYELKRVTPRRATAHGLAKRLATAMLEAKAGASGPFDSAEQMRRTVLMAEWVIARMPFHDLALIENADGLTEAQRQDQYRVWLRDA